MNERFMAKYPLYCGGGTLKIPNLHLPTLYSWE